MASPRTVERKLRCWATDVSQANYLYYSPGCPTWRDFSVPLSERCCAYEADTFGSRGRSDYVHNDGSHQRRVGQRPGGTGPSGVCSLDLGLVLFNQCATVVLGVVEMVLEPCTGMVPRLGWLGLGVTSGIA